MTYRGQVENGKLVLVDNPSLPEGAEVEVTVRTPANGEGLSLEEEIATVWAGDVPDDVWSQLPADLSDHLDHYIYGTPKG